MPSHALRLLSVLGILCASCGDPAVRCGAGTVESGHECVVASEDGGVVVDGGSTPPRVDARLVLPSRVLVAPGLVSCPVPMILWDDGREEPAVASDLFEISTDSPSVAVGAEPGDCPFDGSVGLIGVSGGTTDVTVTLLRDGVRAVGSAVVVSLPDEYAIQLGGVRPVRVGGSYPFAQPMSWLAAHQVEPMPDLEGCDCRPVPRFLTLRSADPSIVAVRGAPGAYVIEGVRAGETALIGQYVAPGAGTITTRAPIDAGDGELEQVIPVVYDDSGHLWSYRDPTVGVCVRMALRALYAGYLDLPSSGVTWSSGGGFTQDPMDPARFCAARPGEETLLGCIGTVCAFEDFEIPGGPTADSLSVDVLDASLSPGGAPAGTVVECPRVRVTAAMSDGSMRDVTTRIALRWSIDWDGEVYPYARARTPEGATVETPEGYPCLDAVPPSGAYVAQTLGFTVTYGEASAVFDLDLVPPTR